MWDSINKLLSAFAGIAVMLERYFGIKAGARKNAIQAAEKETPSVAITEESMAQDEKLTAAEQAAQKESGQ